MSRNNRWIVLGCLACHGLAFLSLTGCGGQPEKSLEQAKEAFRLKQLEQAEQLASKALAGEQTKAEATILLADIAIAHEQYEKAVQLYRSVKAADPYTQSRAATYAGQLMTRELGQLSPAVASLSEAVRLDPKNEEARDALSYLLSIVGRRWESVPHFLAMIRARRSTVGHLIGVSVLEKTLDGSEILLEAQQRSPNDALPHLGMGRQFLEEQNYPRAEEELLQAVELDSSLAEAHARLGHLWIDNNRLDQWSEWRSRLSESHWEHPEIWVVQGRWERLSGHADAAIRCYLEALRRDPNHRRAVDQAAALLNATEHSNLATQLAQRSSDLSLLHVMTSRITEKTNRAETFFEIGELTEKLGRYWEAIGWYREATKRKPNWADPVVKARNLEKRVKDRLDQTYLPDTFFANLDVDAWPLPEESTQVAGQGGVESGALRTSKIQFVEEAAARGLDFRYLDGHPEQLAARRMFSVDGGGIAVLDYDQDGWPDVYLTQGSRLLPNEPQTEAMDRLFRNQGDGTFQDVTEAAGIREYRFGQGVTVGDYDNDGYPDLYVANIGRNSLWHNQGDGTFREIDLGDATDEWTASCVMADLNQDGFPDLYDANYLTGRDVFFRICPDANGVPRICRPLNFPPCPDRILISSADGGFLESGDAIGLRQEDGRGMGLLAADYDGSGRLGLFVSNDVSRNFFFANDSAQPGQLQMKESALLFGLAFDAVGQSQACMGIANLDVNQDGRVDLFVTNFYNESNCLYVQQADGTYLDQTRKYRLAEPSFMLLGFGTQALDADLDGYEDLILTNGHVTNEEDLGVPFRMRPQFFRNSRGTAFTELESSQLGAFFSEQKLGRSLARFDWNRDLRMDVLIGFLEDPVSLLTNHTENVGNGLALRLVATSTARDAIGARVVVTWLDPDQKLERRFTQLVAGDGFQASNERVLILGTDDATQLQSLKITWPSGAVSEWNEIASNQRFTIIEGDTQLYAELP